MRVGPITPSAPMIRRSPSRIGAAIREEPESENNLFSEPMKIRTPSPCSARSSMPRQPDGWSFRTEQQGLELRGRIQVEPRHWVTLRHEDVRGRLFYRTSARMARLEVLALERGKPRGFFATPFDSWLEWTTRERPIVSPELR